MTAFYNILSTFPILCRPTSMCLMFQIDWNVHLRTLYKKNSATIYVYEQENTRDASLCNMRVNEFFLEQNEKAQKIVPTGRPARVWLLYLSNAFSR